MLALAERALAPLDHVRSLTLRALGRRGRVLFGSRDARVLLFAALATATTFALTVLAPIWLLAVGPIVLGVPHLVADARYLVARPGLHRRPGLVAAVGAPLAATWLWPSAAVALIGVAAVAVVARGAWHRRAIVLLLGIAAVAAADHGGYAADLVLAHAHNLVAFALWWTIAPRSLRHLAPIALVALGVAAIVAMPAGPPSHDLDEFIQVLSPVGAGAWGAKLVLAFAFLQSAHYAVWLRLVPEDARERTGIRSFARTLRALVRDLGGWLVVAAAVAAAAVIGYGVVDASAARLGYLRAAYAHGFVELAVLALVFVEGTAVLRRQREPAA